MAKSAIETTDAPAAIGPYSQAVRSGNMVFCSGQLGLDPETGELVAGGVEAQARRIFSNLRAILKAAGAQPDDIVRTTIYLTDLGDFARVNEIYADFFAEPFPSRVTIGVASLPKGAVIEIDATAITD